MEVIIGAIISAVVPAIIGVFLSKRISANGRTMAAIHILVNGRLHEALRRIDELELEIEERLGNGTETPND